MSYCLLQLPLPSYPNYSMKRADTSSGGDTPSKRAPKVKIEVEDAVLAVEALLKGNNVDL